MYMKGAPCTITYRERETQLLTGDRVTWCFKGKFATLESIVVATGGSFTTTAVSNLTAVNSVQLGF